MNKKILTRDQAAFYRELSRLITLTTTRTGERRLRVVGLEGRGRDDYETLTEQWLIGLEQLHRLRSRRDRLLWEKNANRKRLIEDQRHLRAALAAVVGMGSPLLTALGLTGRNCHGEVQAQNQQAQRERWLALAASLDDLPAALAYALAARGWDPAALVDFGGRAELFDRQLDRLHLLDQRIHLQRQVNREKQMFLQREVAAYRPALNPRVRRKAG